MTRTDSGYPDGYPTIIGNASDRRYYIDFAPARGGKIIEALQPIIAIAGQVSKSLEAIKIRLKPSYFTKLFGELVDLLQMPSL